MTWEAPQVHAHCSSSAGLQDRELLAHAKVSWIYFVHSPSKGPSLWAGGAGRELVTHSPLGVTWCWTLQHCLLPLSPTAVPVLYLKTRNRQSRPLSAEQKGQFSPWHPLGDSSKCALHLVRSFACSQKSESVMLLWPEIPPERQLAAQQLGFKCWKVTGKIQTDSAGF